MNSPPQKPRPPRFIIPWDAWILIALGILGLLVLVFRQENLPPEGPPIPAPPKAQVSQESVAPDSIRTELVASFETKDIHPPPVLAADTLRNSSPSLVRERYTADPGLIPMDSLVALHHSGGSSFLPSGIMVTPPGSDVMVWVPLDQPPPDSFTHDPFHEALPHGKNTSVTDCLRVPPKSARTPGR